MPSGYTSPVSYDYGTVAIGNHVDLTITVFCNTSPGDEDISWDHSITGSGEFSVVSDDGGASVGTPGTVVVRFTPGGGSVSGSLVLTDNQGNMYNSPLTVALTGNGAAGGFLTLTPQTTNDFGSVKDGVASSVLNVLLQNNSDTDVIVSAIAFNGDFSAGGALPAMPFTQHANGADPAVVIPVIFTPSVTGFHVTANAVVATSNAPNSPTDQAMQGTGVVITPAYTINLQPQAVLMAFVTDAGSPTILKMDSTDLDCEEPASFKRIYDWGAALFEKYLGRVILRYEDESAVPFDFTVTCRAPRTPSPVSVSVINEGGLNDSLIHNVFADFQISDDLVEVQVSRGADDGPMVITEMFHEVDKRGEVIEAT